MKHHAPFRTAPQVSQNFHRLMRCMNREEAGLLRLLKAAKPALISLRTTSIRVGFIPCLSEGFASPIQEDGGRLHRSIPSLRLPDSKVQRRRFRHEENLPAALDTVLCDETLAKTPLNLSLKVSSGTLGHRPHSTSGNQAPKAKNKAKS